MQNFSVIFLGFFVSEVVIGNYGTALKGLSVIMVFYASVVTVLLPTFSEAAKKSVKRAYSEGVFNAHSTSYQGAHKYSYYSVPAQQRIDCY